jgi:hypothetical protein
MEINELLRTTDGNTWATEFIKLNKDKKIDHEMMLGWFANAIETGRSAGIRQVAGDPSENSFWRIAKKDFANKTESDKALLGALLVMSVRGDLYVPGCDRPCSAMTMEEIFTELNRIYNETMLVKRR